MVEPQFADSLIQKFNDVDWSDYFKLYDSFANNKKIIRSIEKSIKSPPIPYNEIGFFKNIQKLPKRSFVLVKDYIDDLKEKCHRNATKKECMDCMSLQDDKYEKCMKYLFGHYVGNNGGHHHGHETCDILAESDYLSQDVTVAFLFKAGELGTSEKAILFRQFWDCSKDAIINIISVVNNSIGFPTTGQEYRRFRMQIESVKKLWCIIGREALADIVYDFHFNKMGGKTN